MGALEDRQRQRTGYRRGRAVPPRLRPSGTRRDRAAPAAPGRSDPARRSPPTPGRPPQPRRRRRRQGCGARRPVGTRRSRLQLRSSVFGLEKPPGGPRDRIGDRANAHQRLLELAIRVEGMPPVFCVVQPIGIGVQVLAEPEIAPCVAQALPLDLELLLGHFADQSLRHARTRRRPHFCAVARRWIHSLTLPQPAPAARSTRPSATPRTCTASPGTPPRSRRARRTGRWRARIRDSSRLAEAQLAQRPPVGLELPAKSLEIQVLHRRPLVPAFAALPPAVIVDVAIEPGLELLALVDRRCRGPAPGTRRLEDVRRPPLQSPPFYASWRPEVGLATFPLSPLAFAVLAACLASRAPVSHGTQASRSESHATARQPRPALALTLELAQQQLELPPFTAVVGRAGLRHPPQGVQPDADSVPRRRRKLFVGPDFGHMRQREAREGRPDYRAFPCGT